MMPRRHEEAPPLITQEIEAFARTTNLLHIHTTAVAATHTPISRPQPTGPGGFLDCFWRLNGLFSITQRLLRLLILCFVRQLQEVLASCLIMSAYPCCYDRLRTRSRSMKYKAKLKSMKITESQLAIINGHIHLILFYFWTIGNLIIYG